MLLRVEWSQRLSKCGCSRNYIVLYKNRLLCEVVCNIPHKQTHTTYAIVGSFSFADDWLGDLADTNKKLYFLFLHHNTLFANATIASKIRLQLL